MGTRNLRFRGLGAMVSAEIGRAVGAAVALAAQWQSHTGSQEQRLHWEMLSKAIDGPELAEVLDAVSPRKQRQFLFAHALYTNTLAYHRMGNMSREEFFGFARSMLRNPVFREYWNASRPHRATLVGSSEEAELGCVVDDLLEQLEEADTDEWWVVGEAPD